MPCPRPGGPGRQGQQVLPEGPSHHFVYRIVPADVLAQAQQLRAGAIHLEEAGSVDAARLVENGLGFAEPLRQFGEDVHWNLSVSREGSKWMVFRTASMESVPQMPHELEV